MCISRRLLEPCAHGAGLIVAAFSARDILRCVKLTTDGDRDTAAASACGKPRAYFFIFLVFLATFLVALAVFFAFFAFFAMFFLVRSVGLRMCGRCEPARAIKLTRNEQKLYHVRLARVLERCNLAIMSSADVPPTRGLRDIRDGGDYVSRFVDSHRWLLELDLLGYI